jgi:hypothetical protein
MIIILHYVVIPNGQCTRKTSFGVQVEECL